jgi:predicted PurR-regulated permease PerM
VSESARRLQAWLQFAGLVLVVAVLYVAQAVFVPLALAALLTFLLAPLVTVLQRVVGRAASVTLVVVLTTGVIAAAGWGLAVQLTALAHELPLYRANIREKIADIRGAGRDGTLGKVQETVEDIKEEIEKPDPQAPRRPKEPVAVVEADKGTRLWTFPASMAPLANALAMGGLVVVLVVFMLLERQEIRNRAIRLLGGNRLTLATRALDEAAARISGYLLRQSIVNGTFGLGAGLGLYVLGVPHAFLWGAFAAALRFVPYLGPWLGALAPIALSLAVFPGWSRPLLVVGLFIVLELFTNLVMETVLYAGAAGVSQVGLLVAIAFWTWLWGAPGLLLATPLTVCLVVFGKHVPGLDVLVTVLGDAPVLAPDVAFYQRVLADDEDEAAEIVEGVRARDGRDAAFDAVVLPAVAAARRDGALGQLSQEEERAVLGRMARILDDVLASDPEAARPEPGARSDVRPIPLLGCPVAGESDELALRMLRQILDPATFALEVASSRLLSSEVAARLEEQPVRAVVLAAVPPGGLGHARYLCKKLRAARPDLKILVGRWGPDGDGGDNAAAALREAGADAVGSTLAQTREHLYQLAPVLVGGEPSPRPTAA